MPEAKTIESAYKEGFKGIYNFKLKGSAFVRTHGYILMCAATGHKMYWQDWKKWRQVEDFPEQLKRYEFSKSELDEHNRIGADWDRLALNSVTQGSGAVIIKLAMIIFFNWIVKEGLFNTVLLCDLVHDEAVVEYPEHMKDIVVPKLKAAMEIASSTICKKLPIPAEAETGDHWIH